jgi:hypothetical protein
MRKPVLTLTFIIGLGLASWYAIANDSFTRHTAAPEDGGERLVIAGTEGVAEPSDEEKEALKEVQALFAHVTSGAPFYMESRVEYRSPVDTTQLSFPYSYYRYGAELYVKNAEQLSINTPAYYTVADYQLKRLVVMPSRQLQAPALIPANLLGKNLKSEGYTIERSAGEGLVTIRILNPTHLTCKEMTLVFNPDTRVPVSLLYRLTDGDHPEAAYDKTMLLRITHWEQAEAAVKAHALPAAIQLQDGQPLPGAAFRGFEILNLLNK